MEELDFEGIQQVLDKILGTGMDFQQMVAQGAGGENILSWKGLADMVCTVLLKELVMQKQLWLHILILTVAAAVLLHFSDVFQNQNVSQVSFFMIYMILFLLLLTSFRSSMGIAEEVMKNMRDFMTVLAPAYFLALTLASYLTSAGVYYEFILLLISAVRWFAEVFILPCIEIYVLLELVNHLSREARLSRFSELVSMVVGWSLKASLALVTGFHMIQGLLSPAADAVRTSAAGSSLGMLPGVGDVSSSVADLALGSAMLIKNSVGAAALVALILICLVPLVKLLVVMGVFYILAAVLQPISDERITGCLTGIGNGVKLLFQTVFTVLLLFLLSIALVTAMTGH